MKNNLWALLALFLVAGYINAQDDIDIKLSGTYAIQNAHIIQKPGQSIEKGTIVIKDGVIIAVGQNVTTPADAIIVKGDSMYVYPGFIDAYNDVGVKKKEEDKDQEKVKNPGNPPNDRAGIMPDRTLADVFDGDDKSISSWREAGFTASLSAPSKGMLPGMTSLILHSGKDASQSILVENNGMLGTFQNASRIYPATILGVMAKYRDLFRQTSYAMKHGDSYKANPVGMARPSYDKSLTALMPVVSKKQYLYMDAEKYKDIARAMTLQKDLNFNLALVNVKQGSQHIDVIKSKQIPVVLSLEVPESEEDKKDKKKDGKKKDGDKDKKDDDDEDEKEDEDKEKEEKVKKEIDPEMEALNLRRDEAIVTYQSQAAMFAKSGVAFGFSGKDVKGKDVKKNAKLMMKHGLTEDQMLAALTVNPAKMYGVSNIMGTLEKGKIANLFVSTAPYFEEDSKIKYVFVEGEQFEYEIEKKKDKVEGKEGEITGLYDCVLEIPGDQQNLKINISKDGDSYEITVENDGEETAADAVDVDGGKVSFPMEVDNDGFTLKLKFDFIVKEGEIEGSVVAGQFGTFPLKGERVGDPK